MAIRHQRDYQKPEIREQQTIQWPQDTKGIIRSRKSENNRQNNGHKIPKGLSEAGNQRTTDKTMATRYQRDYQKPEIREQQTKQWPQYTKGIIRSRKSENNRQNNGHKIPKGLSEAGNQITTDKTMATRYQRDYQKPEIREQQTKQWPQENG